MVSGKQKRVQKEVSEIMEKLPFPKIDKNFCQCVKVLALFCTSQKKEFKKWVEENV